MKKSKISLAVFLFLLMSLGMPLPGVDASSHGSGSGSSSDNKSALRKCGGLYKGNWLSPKCEVASTGNLTDIFATLPLELKIPRRGKGKTVGRIDVWPELGGSNPRWVDLKTRFKKPNVRQGGNKKVYRGNAVLKLVSAGAGVRDWIGSLKVRVTHKSSKYVIDQGNFQFYDTPVDRKYVGQIKARKR